MTGIFEQATAFHYIAFLFLIAYFSFVMLGKKSWKKILKCATAFVAVSLVIYVFLIHIQRKEIRESLQEMLNIANYTKEIDDRLANGTVPSEIVHDLQAKKAEIEKKAKELSLCDKVLGRSEDLDTLVARLDKKIDQEIFRVENMSLRSSEIYVPSLFEKTHDELYLINPVFTSASHLNVGVVIDEVASFKKDNALLVRIVRTDNDSLLYQQTYIPKSGANSFVLPNIFDNDMVQLQIGYINKTEQQTYHYISCIPYEQK